ncbi:MAG: complex I NDUFA9 subunit family protein [Chloroflexota bacterium]
MVCCVTGSTGFVGRHIVKDLCARGLQVRCLTRPTSDLRPLVGLGVETVQGDITSVSSLERALQGVETVVHLVAIIRESKGATFESINLTGTKNLLKAAKSAGVKRIVYMSNLGAGPDQRFPLLYNKWRAEEEVKNSGMDFVILRPSVIFGRGDGFITVLADAIKKSPVAPVIGSGSTRFQMISVEDVAACVAQSLQDEGLVNQTLPLGGPEQLTYEQVLDLILDRFRIRRPKVHIPVSLMQYVVGAGEQLRIKLPITPAQLDLITRDNVTDLDVVQSVFGFSPVPLNERIDKLVR